MKFILVVFICLLFSRCYVYKAKQYEDVDNIPSIENRIEKDKLYQIKVDNYVYKIQAKQWEKDSLIAQVNFKEDKIKKFHKNQIEEVKERKFSRGRSDALTFGIYGGIAALIILLTQ